MDGSERLISLHFWQFNRVGPIEEYAILSFWEYSQKTSIVIYTHRYSLLLIFISSRAFQRPHSSLLEYLPWYIQSNSLGGKKKSMEAIVCSPTSLFSLVNPNFVFLLAGWVYQLQKSWKQWKTNITLSWCNVFLELMVFNWLILEMRNIPS